MLQSMTRLYCGEVDLLKLQLSRDTLIGNDNRMHRHFGARPWAGLGKLSPKYPFFVFVATCESEFATAAINLCDCRIQTQCEMQENCTMVTYKMGT